MHVGTVTFGGNRKRPITRVGKIGIPPYLPIYNVYLLKG